MQRPVLAIGSVATASVRWRERKLFEFRSHNVIGEIAQSRLIESARIPVKETAVAGIEDEGRRRDGAKAFGEIGGRRDTTQRVDDRRRAREVETNRPEAAFDQLLRAPVTIGGFLH